HAAAETADRLAAPGVRAHDAVAALVAVAHLATTLIEPLVRNPEGARWRQRRGIAAACAAPPASSRAGRPHRARAADPARWLDQQQLRGGRVSGFPEVPGPVVAGSGFRRGL